MRKPSQPPVYRNVTGRINEIIVLNYVEDMFKTYTNVLESIFLQEFIALDTVPNILNPKFIIQKMLQRYFSNVVRVHREPDFSQTFIFTFSKEGYEHKVSFSNCMKFNQDICIICFLHHMTIRNSTPYINDNFETCETVQILTKLMRNKYGIEFDHELIPIEDKFTMDTIVQCFPSITLDMIHNNYKHIGLYLKLVDFSLLFPDFRLPKMIFIPLITLFLPKLGDPPIAILVAISMFIKFRAPATASEYPLDLAYREILKVYNYSIVPERLKLKLCTQWNIVIKQDNVYKFAPCFAAHRLKAKCLISELKPNDPKLKNILSKI